MGKIIAVWGSPNSGKTSVSINLAKCIYSQYKAVITVVLCDVVTPALSVVLPNNKNDDLYSLSVPLSKTEITQPDVLKSIVPIKNKKNFGIMGFKHNDNKFSYPNYDSKKAKELLYTLADISSVVIIDLTSDLNDILSLTAFEEADKVIRLATPDLKSMSFFISQLPLYVDPKYKSNNHINCINVNANDYYIPLSEIMSHFGNVDFILPYSQAVKMQSINGELLNNYNDKEYNQILNMIVEKLV